MKFTVAIFVLLGGAVVGAWRSGRADRSLLACSAPLPVLLVCLTLAGIAYLLLTRGGAEDMSDLAVVVTAMLGGLGALLAFVGGLIGALLCRSKTSVP